MSNSTKIPLPSLAVIFALVAPTALNLILKEPSAKLVAFVDVAIVPSVNVMLVVLSSASDGAIVVLTLTVSPTFPLTDVGET